MNQIALAEEILEMMKALPLNGRNDIDRDLLLEKIRILYSDLKKSDQHPPFAQATQNISEVTVAEQEKKAEPQPKVMANQMVTETVIPQIELPTEEIFLKPEKPAPQPEKEQEKERSASLNDRYSTPAAPLHEQVRKTSGLNERFVPGDLKALIDLNKQVVLTTELFKGNGAAFMKAVNQLNQAGSYEDAQNVAEMLWQEEKWNRDSQSARLFEKLIRQKFGRA